MAQVKFKPDSPVQSLSGTYCGATYRTLPSGRTVMHLKQPYEPGELRNRPEYVNSPQRAKYIIERCTWLLQSEISDIQEAMNRREPIIKQLQRIYKNVNVALFPLDEELVTQLLIAYRNANTGHRLPSRQKSEKRRLFTGFLPG